jgi:hypothetical protein
MSQEEREPFIVNPIEGGVQVNFTDPTRMQGLCVQGKKDEYGNTINYQFHLFYSQTPITPKEVAERLEKEKKQHSDKFDELVTGIRDAIDMVSLKMSEIVCDIRGEIEEVSFRLDQLVREIVQTID